VQLPPHPVVEVLRQRLVERLAAGPEQRRGRVLDRPVGVHLAKDPLGPTLDVDVLVDPAHHPLLGRRIVAGQRPVLDPDRHPPGLPGQRQRPLDQEQPVLVARADPGPLAVLEAAPLGQVADRPVDLVDDVRLAGVGGRREGEVGVAAGLEQER
jgi:hypothetical protein